MSNESSSAWFNSLSSCSDLKHVLGYICRQNFQQKPRKPLKQVMLKLMQGLENCASCLDGWFFTTQLLPATQFTLQYYAALIAHFGLMNPASQSKKDIKRRARNMGLPDWLQNTRSPAVCNASVLARAWGKASLPSWLQSAKNQKALLSIGFVVLFEDLSASNCTVLSSTCWCVNEVP